MTLNVRDISTWQGAFDYGSIPDVEAVIAKASEGNGYVDPQWRRNQSLLLTRPHGLVGGSYAFTRPDLGGSVQAEARFYLDQHSSAVFAHEMPWIFALDAESAGGSRAWVDGWCDYVDSQIGYKSWFYSYTSWISSRGIQRFGNPLWVAAPSSPPGQPPSMGWPAVTMHQFGTVNGVDANLFLGDQAALLALAGIGSAPAPKPQLTYAGGSDGMLSVAEHPSGRLDLCEIGTDGNVYHLFAPGYAELVNPPAAQKSESLGQPPGEAAFVTCTWRADGNYFRVLAVARQAQAHPSNPGVGPVLLTWIKEWSAPSGWTNWNLVPQLWSDESRLPAGRGAKGDKGDPGLAGQVDGQAVATALSDLLKKLST